MPESARLRADIRAGRHSATSRGQAPGFVQCNLAILPREFAFDFMLYCQRNQRACPVLEVTDPGDPVPRRLAPGADLRTDCARYTVFIDGVAQAERTDITDLWRDDLVGFLIGSGITFDAALERAGVPTDRHRWVLRTRLPTEPAGPFRGDLIVTMRWLDPAQAIVATQVTARFPFNHGAPIHIGDAAAIGADIAAPMFGGPVPAMPPGLTALFWACGVTPQSAAQAARLPLFITHAPAHAFITDLAAERLMQP
ncbi:MAG: DUF1445 domain-containing protein [Proteobacteria bacterium]|nr:DUF1445 domain-containing protein [Pseudomonadota bacterium]